MLSAPSQAARLKLAPDRSNSSALDEPSMDTVSVPPAAPVRVSRPVKKSCMPMSKVAVWSAAIWSPSMPSIFPMGLKSVLVWTSTVSRPASVPTTAAVDRLARLHVAVEDEDVVPVAAGKLVASRPAVDGIVALAADDGVGLVGADDRKPTGAHVRGVQVQLVGAGQGRGVQGQRAAAHGIVRQHEIGVRVAELDALHARDGVQFIEGLAVVGIGQGVGAGAADHGHLG